MEDLTEKWRRVVDAIKDDATVKIRRDTVVKGVTKPFGILTRNGDIIHYTPAKSMRGSGHAWPIEKAAKELADLEALSAFYF